jgi:hypothetical protein
MEEETPFMGQHFIVAAFLILVFSLPADSGPNLSGKWETRVMGHKLEANIKQDGAVVTGVAYIFGSDGHKVTYHLNGHFQNGRLQLVHSDGHSFSGRLLDARHLAGTVKAASGRQLNVTLSRR